MRVLRLLRTTGVDLLGDWEASLLADAGAAGLLAGVLTVGVAEARLALVVAA